METLSVGTTIGASQLQQPLTTNSLTKARIAASSVFFVLGCAIATWLSRLPSIQEHHHADPSSLSLALLSCSIGSVAAMRVSPWLGSRLGSPSLVTYSAILLCLWFPLLAAANSFVLLC